MEDAPERNASQPQPEDQPAETGADATERVAQLAASESGPAESRLVDQPVTAGEQPAAGGQKSLADGETAEPDMTEATGASHQPSASEMGAEVAAEEALEPSQLPAARADESPSAEAPEVATAESTEAPAEVAAAAPAADEAPAAPPQPAGTRMVDLQPGMVLDGTVTRIERYGAFVNLGLVDRRDGLIHISQLASYRVRRVEDVVKVGDEVRARVLSVDPQRGRISLSLNDVPDEAYAEAAAPAEPTMTSMALAFERAFGRRQEREVRQKNDGKGGAEGERRRREHEELMRKLRSSNPT